MNRWLAVLLPVALGVPGCGGGTADDKAAAEGGAATESQVATEAGVEANKEIVRRFVAAMNARDFDALDELVAEDVTRHSPSTPGVSVNSREEFEAFLRRDFASVPDAVQTIEMLVAEGDKVAGWFKYSGTQEGPMGPYPASGESIDLDFAGVLRIEEGRIAEIWAVWDNLSMLTQLGHMQPPGS